MESNQNLLSADIQVDSISHSHLKETAMWAKLLAIVGLVISVILALVALFAGAAMETITAGIGGGGIFLSLVYLVIAGIYFALSLFMLRFSTKMKLALQTVDQQNFNDSLYNLKMVYRITGIIVIIYLALMVLGIVIAIGAAAFAS